MSTSSSSYADCLEIWEPHPSGILMSFQTCTARGLLCHVLDTELIQSVLGQNISQFHFIFKYMLLEYISFAQCKSSTLVQNSLVLLLKRASVKLDIKTILPSQRYRKTWSICGNKMPTRCNRGFYCRSYCLLNMFRKSCKPDA